MFITLIVDDKKYLLPLQKGDDAIVAIDNFLKINKIKLNNLTDLKVVEEDGDGLISRRVAQTIIKIFKFAVS